MLARPIQEFDSLAELESYLQYVEGKIEIDEVPLTIPQWQEAEKAIADALSEHEPCNGSRFHFGCRHS